MCTSGPQSEGCGSFVIIKYSISAHQLLELSLEGSALLEKTVGVRSKWDTTVLCHHNSYIKQMTAMCLLYSPNLFNAAFLECHAFVPSLLLTMATHLGVGDFCHFCCVDAFKRKFNLNL